MLKVLINRTLFLAGFKVEKFQPSDFKTMCALIKEKFPVYNEAIQIHKDIKLIDENGKLIGRYTASEARKKATTLKKDIVLVNQTSNPAICKVYSFRESILKKFYDEIVNKRNEQLIKKASTSKHLKISINLTENQMQIKAKQINQLAKKNFNVRIYAICKANQKDVALHKFDYVKSLIQNKCIIEKDIRVEEYIPKEDEFDTKGTKQDEEPNLSISMIVKSKQNQFISLLNESSTKDPDQAIQVFLQRYYKQQDVQMKDLKATQIQVEQEFQSFASKVLTKPKGSQKKGDDKPKGSLRDTMMAAKKPKVSIQKQQQNWNMKHSYVQREANARILNERLKKILQITE